MDILIKIKKLAAIQLCDLQESSALKSGTGRLPQCRRDGLVGACVGGWQQITAEFPLTRKT